MQKIMTFGIALSALAVTGCNSGPTPSGTPTPGPTMSLTSTGGSASEVKRISGFDICDPGGVESQGVININLPNNFNFSSAYRKVNYKKGSSLGPRNKENGEAFGTGYKANDALVPHHPLDVYMKSTDFDKTLSGYVLVRVLTTKNASWKFFKDANAKFFGVGATEKTPPGAVCGADDTTTPDASPSNIGQIAYFYVKNETLVNSQVPFVIGLKYGDDGGTPVYIDPTIDTY